MAFQASSSRDKADAAGRFTLKEFTSTFESLSPASTEAATSNNDRKTDKVTNAEHDE
eukprot:CAMPEP_0179174326 /NCGR_PEP_ID=MMETSP0796-20121207/86064_1 /TAXON_ID=73915 /ORGANISM="Pyrodinium bahamense, Strain pbaha01" /LENGTH=56 /DNA_ID=CAMNT_0020877617 /DNA_START=56 /DNA_END=227 /DNA_ORIENTATION=-